MENEKKFTLGQSIATIILAPISAWSTAFVTCKLWLWFIVPLGVPMITKTQSIGMALTAGLLLSIDYVIGPATKKTMNEDVTKFIIAGTIRPWTALFAGYLLKWLGQ